METDIRSQRSAYQLLASDSQERKDIPSISSGRSRAPIATRSGTDDAFNAVFDSSGEALVLIDSKGIIHRANSRARELLRLADYGTKLPRISDLLPGADPDAIALLPNRSSAPPRSLDALLGTGLKLRVTLRSILPGSRHLLLCIEESSVVERAEFHWRRVESEIRGILESVQAAIVLYDAAGRIRFANARFGELLGIDLRILEKLQSRDELDELIAPRFHRAEDFRAPWRSFVHNGGEPGHDELEIVRPVSRTFQRFYRPLFDAQGRAIGWLERYSDVTAERQIQSKLVQTEKMAALGQLVSGIAHELNNPLTAIMGYAQLLLGKGLVPETLSEAEKVYQEAERARRIVKSLLYFARESRPERTRVDLNEVIERTLALRSYELRVEDIEVDCRLAPDLPPTMADPHQLQQVILNLIVNAEQAVLEARGRGRVSIRTHHLARLKAPDRGGRIFLEVSDDGPGIPPEIASRVFDPFFTSKPPGVGTGLGLSIVYGIVQQHDGKVSLDNQPGAGARFIVELPVVEPSAESSVEGCPPPRPGKTVAPASILAIEDEPTVAQLIVDVFQEEGHRVEAVLNGEDGLRRLSTNRYDLVICDLRMPLLNGQAVYQSLRQAGSPLADRILFITGDVLAAQTRQFLEPNRLPYLAKPFLVEELKLAVNRLLDSVRESESAPGSGSASNEKHVDIGRAKPGLPAKGARK